MKSMTKARYMARYVALLIALAIPGFDAKAQSVKMVLSGIVRDSKGQPLENASIALSFDTIVVGKTSTSKTGTYRLVIDTPKDKLSITVSAIGYTRLRDSITIGIVDSATEIVSVTRDFLLTAINTEGVNLKSITVARQRKRPQREAGNNTVSGDLDNTLITSGVSRDQQGNVEELLKNNPNVVMTPDGARVLGTDPDQSNTTLNGMVFNGSQLPAGVASVTLNTASFDPSRGGYSGGQTSINVRQGHTWARRSISIGLDAPALQIPGRNGRQLGQTYSNVNLNLNSLGSLFKNKLYYNAGVRHGRRWSDLRSLNNIDQNTLLDIGISPSLYGNFINAVGNLNIPISPQSPPSNSLNTVTTAIARIDKASTTYGRRINAIFQLQKTGTEGLGTSPFALMSTGGKSTGISGSALFQHSHYIREAFLHNTDLMLSRSTRNISPYISMANASVRLSDSSLGGSTIFNFGGNNSMLSRSSDWQAELRNDLSWISYNAKHLWKVTLTGGFNSTNTFSHSGKYGSFAYNNLNDLLDNSPSTFTKTLDSRNVSTGIWSASASIGDTWTLTQQIKLQYGLRIDAARFNTAPQVNLSADSTLNIRTGYAPREIAISPRLGFIWIPGADLNKIFAGGFNIYQDEKLVSTTIRGGTGVFSSTLQTNLLSNSLLYTGLPSGIRTLRCIGAAAPIPDWDLYASNPSLSPETCADGTASQAFTDATPRIVTIGRDYKLPKSWRTTLSVTHIRGPVRMLAEGLVSISRSQPEWNEINFVNTPQFVLAEEADRPVFVSNSDIIESAAMTASSQSRRSQLFGSVRSLRSSGSLTTRSISLQLSPAEYKPYNGWFIRPVIGYRLSAMNSRTLGFNESTGGDPTKRESSRAPGDSRHSLSTSLSISKTSFSIAISGQFASGQPYTPLVQSDINGDGYINDRAFIPVLEQIGGSQLSTDIDNLLANSDRGTRKCILNQAGRIAAKNSCISHWSQNVTINASARGSLIGVSDRVSINLFTSNIAGVLDQLLHGKNGTKGWGSQGGVNSYLLIPKSFNASMNRFTYDVNPYFGSNRVSQNLIRTPFSVSLSVSINLAPSDLSQRLTQNISMAKAGPASDSAKVVALKNRLSTAASSFFMELGRTSLSRIKATEQQVAFIDSLGKQFNKDTDSAKTHIAKTLLAMRKVKITKEITAQYTEYERHVDRIFYEVYAPKVLSILTLEQLELLPEYIRLFLNNSGKFSVWSM